MRGALDGLVYVPFAGMLA